MSETNETAEVVMPRALTLDDLKAGRAALHAQVDAFADRIAPVYVVLQWEWGLYASDLHVPDRDAIAYTLRDLIDGITQLWPAHPHIVFAETGGLGVRLKREDFTDNPDMVEARIYFTCESISYYD